MTFTARSLRLFLALLLAIVIAGCAGKAVTPLPPPPEVAAWTGQVRLDSWTNPDGLAIHGRYWLPAQAPRAVVVLVHGTAMHAGLYDELGRYLAARDYVVYGIDLQGWGQSDGIGARGDVLNHDSYVTDVAILSERLRAEFPGKPLFLFGESLGGTVLLLGKAERRLHSDGLILSAPGYKPHPGMLGLRAPAILNDWAMSSAAWFAGKFETLPAIHSDLGLRLVVNDRKVLEQMLEDPYVTHGFLPARYVSALVEANNFIEPRLEMVNVPLLVLQGKRDELIAPASAHEVYKRALVRDKEFHLFDQMGHAIMLQQERYEGMVLVGEWLDQRTLPARAPRTDAWGRSASRTLVR